MSREAKPPAKNETKPKRSKPIDVPHAPVVFFDEVPTYAYANGVVSLTLGVYRHIPKEEGGIQGELLVASYLRCSIPAALALRDAISQALLVAVPTKGDAN